MIRRLIVAMLVAGALGGASGHAQACKCNTPPAGRQTVPADGTKGFPIDGRIRVFLTGFPPAIRQKMGEEYRLRDGAGALVPIDTAVEGTMLTLRPRAILNANARYTVERVFAYERGSRLSDQERGLRALRGVRNSRSPSEPGKVPAEVSRLWFPDSRFETGAGPGTMGAAPTGREVHIRVGSSSCGFGPSLVVRAQAPGFRATDVIAIERKDAGVVRYFAQLPGPGDFLHVGNDDCAADPQVVSTMPPFVFRVVVVSPSDQRAPSDWVEAGVDGEPAKNPREEPPLHVRWDWKPSKDGGDGVKNWFSSPAREPATRSEPPGPIGCPWGLESRGTKALVEPATAMERPFASDWAPVAAARRGETTFVVGSFWNANEPPRLLVLAPGQPGKMIELSDPGRADMVRFGDSGILSSLSDRSSGAPGLEGTRPVLVGWDGKVVWKGVFGGRDVYNSPAALASNPERTLVCWAQSPPGKATDGRLVCVVLASRDGRVLRAPFELPGGSPMTSSGMASLALEGGFLVVRTPSDIAMPAEKTPSVSVSRLDTMGTVLSTTVLTAAPAFYVDMAAVGSRVLAAWDGGRDGIEAAWLDAGSLAKAGFTPTPFSLSAGTGDDLHSPRLTPKGDLVAVTWRVGHGNDASTDFVAVIDSAGTVSPAIEVGPGPLVSQPAFAATEGGFVAAYRVRKKLPQIEEFVCRKAPPPVPEIGAPQRLSEPQRPGPSK